MVSTYFKLGIISVMVITGAIDTINFKFQNSQYLYEGPVYKLFFHPYIQTLFMFIAEFLSLPLFIILKRRNPSEYKRREAEAEQKGKALNMNRIFLLVPAFMDFLTSTMQFMALNFISGSAYQMFRGGAIVTTYLFSVLFFKQEVKRKQVIGTSIALVGIIIIGVANVIYAPSSESTKLEIIGYILVISSLVTNGFLFSFEQKLFETFYLEPMEVVGYEGLFGTILCLITVPVLSSVPCSFGISACVFTDSGQAYVEGWGAFMQGLNQSKFLDYLIVLAFISVAIYNVSSVSVTKYINALARAIGANTKIILVWLVGILVTVTLGREHPNYRWQSLNVIVILLQLVGFALLVVGNLVYNEIIRLPGFVRANVLNEQT